MAAALHLFPAEDSSCYVERGGDSTGDSVKDSPRCGGDFVPEYDVAFVVYPAFLIMLDFVAAFFLVRQM